MKCITAVTLCAILAYDANAHTLGENFDKLERLDKICTPIGALNVRWTSGVVPMTDLERMWLFEAYMRLHNTVIDQRNLYVSHTMSGGHYRSDIC